MCLGDKWHDLGPGVSASLLFLRPLRGCAVSSCRRQLEPFVRGVAVGADDGEVEVVLLPMVGNNDVQSGLRGVAIRVGTVEFRDVLLEVGIGPEISTDSFAQPGAGSIVPSKKSTSGLTRGCMLPLFIKGLTANLAIGTHVPACPTALTTWGVGFRASRRRRVVRT